MNLKRVFLIFIIGISCSLFISLWAVGNSSEFAKKLNGVWNIRSNNPLRPVESGEVLGTDYSPLRPDARIELQAISGAEDIQQPKNTIEILPILPLPTPVAKRVVTIAVVGDSMIDTMGEGLPDLKNSLAALYPDINIKLLNFGEGSTTIEEGHRRLSQGHDYMGKYRQAVFDTNPDIIIVESFAYNPFGDDKGLDRHWEYLTAIANKVKSKSRAKLAFLTMIAPSKTTFGDGLGGVNWNENQRLEQAAKIRQYLENTLTFANLFSYPVIDAYRPSLVKNDGNLELINPNDHIDPSAKGKEFVATLIAENLDKLGWLK